MQCKRCLVCYSNRGEFEEHGISCRIDYIIRNVKVPNTEINFFGYGFGSGMYLQLTCRDTCIRTGKWYNWKGRKWLLSRNMTESEIVRTCYIAASAAMEQELSSRFTFQGKAVYEQHFDVRELRRIACMEDTGMQTVVGKTYGARYDAEE